tara:strand:- start:1954 stop:2103 length:150 start_codon:yes stop_codon:yes gene_type:complete
MIRNIIELLPYAKGETEKIRIAKGKYKLPETIKEGYKQIKQELWQRKST